MADVIYEAIEMSQRWALHQHSKPLCILSFHFTLRQLECRDAAPLSSPSCLIANWLFAFSAYRDV